MQAAAELLEGGNCHRPGIGNFFNGVGMVLFVLVGVGLLTRPFWKRIASFFAAGGSATCGWSSSGARKPNAAAKRGRR